MTTQAQMKAPLVHLTTLERQYRNQLHTFPQLTEDQEQALIERALDGEPVRDELIFSFSIQRRIYNFAYRLAAKYLRREQAIEMPDLINSANEAMLRRFQRSLTKENPIAYLLKVARLTMIDGVNGRSDSIKTYQDEESVSVLRLDLATCDDDEALAHALSVEIRLESPQQDDDARAIALHKAIQMLPETQRIVMLRHYGFGHAPEPLNAISRSLSSTSKASTRNNANYHHKRALRTLQQALGSTFPLLSRVGGIQ